MMFDRNRIAWELDLHPDSDESRKLAQEFFAAIDWQPLHAFIKERLNLEIGEFYMWEEPAPYGRFRIDLKKHEVRVQAPIKFATTGGSFATLQRRVTCDEYLYRYFENRRMNPKWEDMDAEWGRVKMTFAIGFSFFNTAIGYETKAEVYGSYTAEEGWNLELCNGMVPTSGIAPRICANA